MEFVHTIEDSPKLDEESLTSSLWRFYHQNGPVSAEALRLLPNGRVGGYSHHNEAFWRIEDGILCFVKDDGATVSTRFTEVSVDLDRIVLRGKYLLNPRANLVLCLEQRSWSSRPEPRNSTKALLHAQIEAYAWDIGDHSYGKPQIFEERQAKLAIGKYTSIAAGVSVALGNHRIDSVSTYPFAALRQYWPSAPLGVNDHATKGDVIIGHDVWIGTGSFIASGVTIGHGAVVGAHSVVTKHVPPYAVVAGNPAKLIRHRFSSDVIERLLQLEWWNWPDEKVDRFLPLMLSDDIQTLLKNAGA